MALNLTPPDPLLAPGALPAWHGDNLRAFLDACPAARATTYRFSQAGNDATGNGSEATPYKTLAKAQTLVGPAVALLFKRGEVWEEATGLTDGGAAGVTFGAYGTTGDRPLLNQFRTKYPAGGGGWTLAAGTKYTRAASSTIAWVRKSDDRRATPYVRAASSAVAAGEWFWGANVLTVDFGVDPNTLNLEAVVANDLHGVTVSGNGSRVDGIACHGWGMNPADPSNQKYPICCAPAGTDLVAVTDCEGLYCSRHGISQYTATSGGRVLIAGCRTGGCLKASGGESVVNGFSEAGGHVFIAHGNEIYWGTLPSRDWYTPGGHCRLGQAVFGHTNSNAFALAVAWGNRVRGARFGAGAWSYFGSLPAAPAPADARGLVVDEVMEPAAAAADEIGTGVNAGMTDGAPLAPSGHVYANCDYAVAPSDKATEAVSVQPAQGWAANCRLTIDLINWTIARFSMFNTGTLSTGAIAHCNFRWSGVAAGVTAMLDWQAQWNGLGYSTGLRFVNNVYAIVGGRGTLGLGVGAGSGNRHNNAYYGVASAGLLGYAADVNSFELAAPPPPDLTPLAVAGGALYAAGTDPLAAAGLAVGADRRWLARDAANPSVGPDVFPYAVEARAGAFGPSRMAGVPG